MKFYVARVNRSGANRVLYWSPDRFYAVADIQQGAESPYLTLADFGRDSIRDAWLPFQPWSVKARDCDLLEVEYGEMGWAKRAVTAAEVLASWGRS